MNVSQMGMLVYAAALALAGIAVAYGLKGTSVFGTKGHTSSEFKLVLFANVNLIAALMLSGLAIADNMTLAKAVAPILSAAWYATAVTNAAYIIGRCVLKSHRGK